MTKLKKYVRRPGYDIPERVEGMAMPANIADVRDVAKWIHERRYEGWEVPSCTACNEAKAGGVPTGDCAFCRRALELLRGGYRRSRKRVAPIASPKELQNLIPALMPGEYYARHGHGPTPHHEGLPKSFDWSS